MNTIFFIVFLKKRNAVQQLLNVTLAAHYDFYPTYSTGAHFEEDNPQLLPISPADNNQKLLLETIKVQF